MIKVFNLLRSLGWYVVSFIYDLIDGIIEIIKKLNAFDIINSLSNNQTFRKFYSGVMAIAVTLFALFIVWKFINKFLNPDEENTMKNIYLEIVKCGVLIMMSTFLFVQVSNFSIALSNYTSNIFENNANVKMSNTMLSLFINYSDGYKNSNDFYEEKTIPQLLESYEFDNDELYLSTYVSKSRIILSDDKDYKYDIDWIMSVICGGFFLYSLFFAGIMLGRRQIEFLFLFAISPIVFATSVGNKQRRGAVIEQLVSLALQSAVVVLIVSLTIMIMQEISITEFFTSGFMNMITKTLLYLGCATFILTGSQVINRFIGSNVSSASGREQLMSLMGYGKMAGIGATAIGGTAIGGGLLATGGIMKASKTLGGNALTKAGISFLANNSSGNGSSGIQKINNTLGTKMFMAGQKMSRNKKISTAGNAFINAGASTINRVMPRRSYNPSYYRRK